MKNYMFVLPVFFFMPTSMHAGCAPSKTKSPEIKADCGDALALHLLEKDIVVVPDAENLIITDEGLNAWLESNIPRHAHNEHVRAYFVEYQKTHPQFFKHECHLVVTGLDEPRRIKMRALLLQLNQENKKSIISTIVHHHAGRAQMMRYIPDEDGVTVQPGIIDTTEETIQFLMEFQSK